MASTKQLQTKKASLIKQKESILAVAKAHDEKLATIEADILAVDVELEAEVVALQKMIDEIRNGATPVSPVVTSDTEAEFN